MNTHIGPGTTSADNQPEVIRGNHGVFAWIGDKAAGNQRKPKGETTHENVYPHKSDTCAVHEAG